jgi:hypothetical protein
MEHVDRLPRLNGAEESREVYSNRMKMATREGDLKCAANRNRLEFLD